MAKEHKTVKEMWEKYLSTIGENINDSGKTYESWYFCNNEKDAHELAALVKKKGGGRRKQPLPYTVYMK